MSENLNLGMIEGFYGHAWSWPTRQTYASFLAKHEYSFYIYAPKDDAFLRSRWQQDWPLDSFQQLQKLAIHYKNQGVDFGMALSPLEVYKNWDASAQKSLIKKIERINQINPDILCILFDDMRGDLPDIARLQIEITHLAQAHSSAKQIIMCPTYYSYEPILEQLFGPRPDNYWQDLGDGLNENIEIFWTGDKVCSTAYSKQSLTEINEMFQRKISLWDNYPVNDGKKTSPFLHIRGFENRPAELAECTQRHAINPMNAAFLSQIPFLTLLDSYQQGESYNAKVSLNLALKNICGDVLGQYISGDLNLFQDQGLDQLSLPERQLLLSKYGIFKNPCAMEICQWLEGYYQFDPMCLTG